MKLLELKKSQQERHQRVSKKTGKVYSAGKGSPKPEEEKLEGAAQYVQMYKDDLRKEAKTSVVTKYKGGFSDDVVFNKDFINYIGEGEFVFGYIGASTRTPERDAITEGELRSQGLDGNGIANWLTSGDGRHLMDDVDKTTTPIKFRKRVREYTDKAFEKVLVWNHPDHHGSSDDTQKLSNKVYDYYKEEVLRNEGIRNDFLKQMNKFLEKKTSQVELEESIERVQPWTAWGDKQIRIQLKNGGIIMNPMGHKLTDNDAWKVMRHMREKPEWFEPRNGPYGSFNRAVTQLGKEK